MWISSALLSSRWRQRWAAGRIEIAGDLALAQTTNSSLYFLLSAIREDWEYGLSPGGLASSAYHGHVFWVSDIAMPREITSRGNLSVSQAGKIDLHCGQCCRIWTPGCFHRWLSCILPLAKLAWPTVWPELLLLV